MATLVAAGLVVAFGGAYGIAGAVDVLGLSWGGGLAQQLAVQSPRKVRRVVLVATGTGALMALSMFALRKALQKAGWSADDVDLWDVSDEDLAHAEALYWALRELHNVGRTRASKLMARKRPRLIPVVDSVIIEALNLGDDSWRALRACLSDAEVRKSIEASRPNNAPEQSISTLRLLDAGVWMRCSQSRHAKNARNATGLTGQNPY